MKILNFITLLCAVISIPLFLISENWLAAIWALNCAIWILFDWLKD
jgi:hypothetical protein